MGMTTRRTKTRRTKRLSHSSIEIHDEHQNQHLAPRRRFAVQPMDPWPVRQLDPRSSRPVDQPRPLLREECASTRQPTEQDSDDKSCELSATFAGPDHVRPCSNEHVTG